MFECIRDIPKQGGKLHGQELREKCLEVNQFAASFPQRHSADSKSTDAEQNFQQAQGFRNTVLEIRSTKEDGPLKAPGLGLGL